MAVYSVHMGHRGTVTNLDTGQQVQRVLEVCTDPQSGYIIRYRADADGNMMLSEDGSFVLRERIEGRFQFTPDTSGGGAAELEP